MSVNFFVANFRQQKEIVFFHTHTQNKQQSDVYLNINNMPQTYKLPLVSYSK